MPIRINLLAEGQGAEDQRRRDPVKRSIIVSVSLIALVLVWCGYVQLQIMRANSALEKHQAHWKSIESRHAEITDDLKQAAEVERKLATLERLSTNRFLVGSTLNALQQTVVEQVQAVRLKTEQTFTLVDPVPAKTNSTRTVAGITAAAIEKTSIVIEAKDWNPADQNYNKFKEAIAKFPVFQTSLAKTEALRLTSLSKPSFEPSDPLRAFVTFTLQLQYPEIRRHE